MARRTEGPAMPAAMPTLTKIPVPRIDPSPKSTAPATPTTRGNAGASPGCASRAATPAMIASARGPAALAAVPRSARNLGRLVHEPRARPVPRVGLRGVRPRLRRLGGRLRYAGADDGRDRVGEHGGERWRVRPPAHAPLRRRVHRPALRRSTLRKQRVQQLGLTRMQAGSGRSHQRGPKPPGYATDA